MITIKIRCTLAIMIQMCLDDNANLLNGEGHLAFTSAKIYYYGGGWYAVSGSAADGSDVNRVITQVKALRNDDVLDISKWVAINKAIQKSPLTGGKRVKVNIKQREYHSPV